MQSHSFTPEEKQDYQRKFAEAKEALETFCNKETDLLYENKRKRYILNAMQEISNLKAIGEAMLEKMERAPIKQDRELHRLAQKCMQNLHDSSFSSPENIEREKITEESIDHLKQLCAIYIGSFFSHTKFKMLIYSLSPSNRLLKIQWNMLKQPLSIPVDTFILNLEGFVEADKLLFELKQLEEKESIGKHDEFDSQLEHIYLGNQNDHFLSTKLLIASLKEEIAEKTRQRENEQEIKSASSEDEKAFDIKDTFIPLADEKINDLRRNGNTLLERTFPITPPPPAQYDFDQLVQACEEHLAALKQSPPAGYAQKEKTVIQSMIKLNEAFMKHLDDYRNILEHKTNPPAGEPDPEHAALFFALRDRVIHAHAASLVRPYWAIYFLEAFARIERLLTQLHRKKSNRYGEFKKNFEDGLNRLKNGSTDFMNPFLQMTYLREESILINEIDQLKQTKKVRLAENLINQIVNLLPEAMQKKTREEHTTKLKEIMALGRLHEITAFIETLKEIKARTDEQFNSLREPAVYYIKKLIQAYPEMKETQQKQETDLMATLETKKTQKDLQEFIAELRTNSRAAEKIQKLLSLVKSPEEKKTCQQDHDSAFQQAKSSSNEENMKPLEDYFKELDYKIKRAERAQNPVQIHAGTTSSLGLYQPIPTAPKGSINNPNPLPQKPPGFLEKIFKR